MQEEPESITGPKTLNVFGAPYIWALFLAFDVVEEKRRKTDRRKPRESLPFPGFSARYLPFTVLMTLEGPVLIFPFTLEVGNQFVGIRRLLFFVVTLQEVFLEVESFDGPEDFRCRFY